MFPSPILSPPSRRFTPQDMRGGEGIFCSSSPICGSFRVIRGSNYSPSLLYLIPFCRFFQSSAKIIQFPMTTCHPSRRPANVRGSSGLRLFREIRGPDLKSSPSTPMPLRGVVPYPPASKPSPPGRRPLRDRVGLEAGAEPIGAQDRSPNTPSHKKIAKCECNRL